VIQKRAAYVYRVETVAAARIREVWTVRSRVPLTPGDLEAVVLHDGAAAHRCELVGLEDETHVTEAAKTIVDVLRVDGGAVQRS
jgi:hypothetical protein